MNAIKNVINKSFNCEAFGIAHNYGSSTPNIKEIRNSVKCDSNVISMYFEFDRSLLKTKTGSPKGDLYQLSVKQNMNEPIYSTTEKPHDRVFKSILTFDGIQYTTTNWHRCKQFAEQSCALICLGLIDYN
ncbi:hypothetical protein GJ496_008451 [Pomphorhynchus laevis]|nr:hypothetical protein GJ496_008451 [Pomphorhynchus laevis]